jgi:hypothetical protein
MARPTGTASDRPPDGGGPVHHLSGDRRLAKAVSTKINFLFTQGVAGVQLLSFFKEFPWLIHFKT